MWQPTHVKVTVRQAKGLICKGKNGTNDVFVVIGMGKEKFQTSIKPKALSNVEWKEECELAIPSQGNKAVLQLTVYHHNSLGLDEFLGQANFHLTDFDVYEKPKYRFHKLQSKADKVKKKADKERGELEILVNFSVKSGSYLDISKKEKNKSTTSLKHLGGSLMSFGGSKDSRGLKDFARSVSSKMDKISISKRKKNKQKKNSSGIPNELMESQQHHGDADPGVISDEDDDFRFDEEVKVYTQSNSPQSTLSRGSSFMHDPGFDEVKETSSPPNSRKPSDALSPKREETDFKVNIVPSTPVKIQEEPHFATVPPVFQSTPHPGTSQTAVELSTPSYPLQDESSFGSSTYYTPIKSPRITSAKSSPEHSLFGNVHASLNDATPKREQPPVPVVHLDYHQDKTVAKTEPSTKIHAIQQKKSDMNTQEKRTIVDRDVQRKTSVEYTTPVTKDPTPKFDKSVIKENNNTTYVTPPLEEVTAPLDDDDVILDGKSEAPVHEDKIIYLDSHQNRRRSLDARKKSYTNETDERRETNSPTVATKPLGARIAARHSISEEPRKITQLARLDSSAVTRTSSLNERTPKGVGRSSITGSNGNISLNDSHVSLNASRASSTHDVRKEDFRQPEIKALTLERRHTNDDTEGSSGGKRKKITALKNKIFHKGGSRERVMPDEDSRIVEGGNDRVPAPPTRTTKLPQEIHDKFAGKSREDLLELILNLQGSMNKQAEHASLLEDYIDNLLLRVMEATPHILQAPAKHGRKVKSFGSY